ncbi:hypothetical protein DYY65_03430 [Nitrososphaera sp. AFS]|nr:hypothetical protein [Nitrososphaera sp. AFS]
MSPYWNVLEAASELRDNQKRGFASSRYWNDKGHFIGLLGEMVYAIKTGQEINLDLIIYGDGGIDFRDVDVKSSPYWRSPYLLIPVGKPMRVNNYVLVGIDIPNKRGYIIGWATKEDILVAERVNFGYGESYRLTSNQLRTGLPYL